MARHAYFPDRGDLVHLHFSPSAQHEIAGPHYALVVSTASFAKFTGFAFVCPITSNTSPWPFDVSLPAGELPPKQGKIISSAVLTDQLKSIDFRDRSCVFIAKVSEAILDEALAKIRAIIDADDPVEEVSAT